MTTYDPSKAPDAEQWLALDEAARINLARDFHIRKDIGVPRLDAHAVIHVVVETQLAEGLPAAVAALARLEAGGLDRHEAIHAMGSVLAEHMRAVVTGSVSSSDPHGPYFAALEKLTADSWRSS